MNTFKINSQDGQFNYRVKYTQQENFWKIEEMQIWCGEHLVSMPSAQKGAYRTEEIARKIAVGLCELAVFRLLKTDGRL